MSDNSIIFPSITPSTFPSYIQSEKPSDTKNIHPLQSPNGLPSLVPIIHDSEFPTRFTSVYSRSIPSDIPSRLPIFHTSVNTIVSLYQTLYDPCSANFSPFLFEFSSFHLTIIF